ncbi:hypothetical protein [Actinoplanes sp. NPDC026670]|uniref:hypothetical protein n=1 Tax=Actinoplanes sp. NPDC026670 TaxID=3154700 RepID=UPI0033F16BA6
MKLGRGTAAFAVALLLGGCAWLEPPIDESELADPALGPAEELLRSVPGAGAPAYRFTIGGGGSCMRAEGVADIAGEAFQLTITMDGPEAGSSISMGFLVLGEETWIRLRLEPAAIGEQLGIPDGWVAFDPERVESFRIEADGGGTDPVGAGDLLANAAGVARAGNRRYSGTLDLTKVTDPMLLSAEQVTALGEAATSVPFTASVDAGGRLSALTTQIPAGGGKAGGTCRIAFTDYGKAATPAAPVATDRSEEAEEKIYEILSS